MNTSIRNTFLENTEENRQEDFQFNHSETQLFATYEIWETTKISGGYGFRIRSLEAPIDEHRLMEQLAFVLYAPGGKRIANRVRLEQRIRPDDYVNRLRYRFGFDSPLNGEQLDPGEAYIILSNEFLWTFNSVSQSSENRLYAGIGWFFNRKYKVESGIQYRLARVNENFENVIWLTNAFYINNTKPKKKIPE